MKKLLATIKEGFKKLATVVVVASATTTIATASMFNAQPVLTDVYATAKTAKVETVVFEQGTKAAPVAMFTVARQAQLVGLTSTVETVKAPVVKTVVMGSASEGQTVVFTTTKLVKKEVAKTVLVKQPVVRTVVKGDTLFAIGMEHNMLWTTVKAANVNITNEDMIKVGQEITIPKTFTTVKTVVKTMELVEVSTNETVKVPAVKVVPTVSNSLTATPINSSVVKNYNVPVMTDTMAIIGVNAKNDAVVETVEASAKPVVKSAVVKSVVVPFAVATFAVRSANIN